MSGKAQELLKKLEDTGLSEYSPQSGDEQDFVDRQIVMNILLPWLGWENRDYEYNRMNAGAKPDFLVRANGIIVFFIEDKSTSENIKNHEAQILEYLKKFSRRGIVCNGLHIWVVELQGNTFKISYKIDFKKAREGLFSEEEKSKIERLYREFSREKFINLDDRIINLAVSEEKFLQNAVDINGREEIFIDETHKVIQEIYLDVYGKLKNSLRIFKERQDLIENGERAILEALYRFYSASPKFTEKKRESLDEIKKKIFEALKRLGYLKPEEIWDIEKTPGRFTPEEQMRLNQLVEILKEYNYKLQKFHIAYSEELSIAEGFLIWLEEWKEFLVHSFENGEYTEEKAYKEYALQVAYTFFIKVFILRVLEDKKLIKRILSNGGFSLWKELVENISLIGGNGELKLNLLFNLAIGHVREKIFSDIEKNKVYDWYVPDDLLFLKLLELMNKYNFRNVFQDIIGYIYEKLMEKIHRHDLGIYLTPPELVDYMLDRVGYKGREIIGKKVIDPSCGSGTFLVHAVRRYRVALKEAGVDNLEEKFIKDVQENFWGVDINSFSVYLAGINLFVQLLDDIYSLIEKGKEVPLVSFKLFAGNTFREYRKLKREGFHYVFSNPPYVNAKRAGFKPPEDVVREFSDRLRGDINTYTLFLCIASEILYGGGKLVYIVPLTLLGDQQTEKLREFFTNTGQIVHITKFHRRTNILFEGVTQAVVVFVWEKTEKNVKPSISWGGVDKESRKEIIEESIRNTVSVDRIVYKFTERYTNAQKDIFNNGGKKVYTVWVVLSGKDKQHAKELYKIFETIISQKKTLRDFLEELGINPDEDFKQGDVNTTYVASYHVEKNNPLAMPIYKGEDLKPFGRLPEEPVGVKGRSGEYRPPYVAPKKEIENKGVNKVLWEIYNSKEEEWLIVLNRIIISLNHPRNIRGCITYRNPDNKKVFTDKVWVLRCKDEITAKKISSLLFSLPFIFQYNAINTNTQINKNILLFMKTPDRIPDEVVEYYNNIEALSEEFKKLGIEDITEHLNLLWYGLKEEVNFEDIIPWETMIAGLPTISLEDFLLRYAQKRKDPKGGKVESYLRDEYWKFVDENVETIINLFKKKYGKERYEATKDKRLLPDNPQTFIKRYTDLKKQFRILLNRWKENLRNIDIAILKAYGLKENPENFIIPLIR